MQNMSPGPDFHTFRSVSHVKRILKYAENPMAAAHPTSHVPLAQMDRERERRRTRTESAQVVSFGSQ